jgi:hypothetical protein
MRPSASRYREIGDAVETMNPTGVLAKGKETPAHPGSCHQGSLTWKPKALAMMERGQDIDTSTTTEVF